MSGQVTPGRTGLGKVAVDVSFLYDRVAAHHGAAAVVGEKLLQNSSDKTRPSAPATMRMIPTVWMLNPEVVTSTAKVRTAPTTSKKMLTPRLKLPASSSMLDRDGVVCLGCAAHPTRDRTTVVAVRVVGRKRRIDERRGHSPA
jgi:hypothetical protein